MKCPRISNPNEFVDLLFEDKGDVHPVYDANGSAHEAYTSYFEFNGQKLYSFVDKWVVLAGGKIDTVSHEARFKSDCDFLATHDLDLAEFARKLP